MRARFPAVVSRRLREVGWIEPGCAARTVHSVHDLERRDQIGRLRRARGRAGAGNGEGRAADRMDDRPDTPSTQGIEPRPA